MAFLYRGFVCVGDSDKPIWVSRCQERFLHELGFRQQKGQHIPNPPTLIEGDEFVRHFGLQKCSFTIDINIIFNSVPRAALITKGYRDDHVWSFDGKTSMPARSFGYIFLSEAQANIFREYLQSNTTEKVPKQIKLLSSPKVAAAIAIAASTMATQRTLNLFHQPNKTELGDISLPLKFPKTIHKNVILEKMQTAQIALLAKYIEKAANKGQTRFQLPSDLKVTLLKSTCILLDKIGWRFVTEQDRNADAPAKKYFEFCE